VAIGRITKLITKPIIHRRVMIQRTVQGRI